MKLVIATPLYPPEIGGPATYAKLLEEGLPKKGIEVELVTFSEVRHLPKIIRHYVYYRHVREVARNADAILALDPVSVGVPAMWAAKRTGKPLVVKIVGDYAWEQGRQRFGVSQTLDEFVKVGRVPFVVRLLQLVQTWVAKNANRIIVPSAYLKSIVMTWGSPSIPNEKIEVIYNAMSLEESGTVPSVVAKLSRPLVVTVGRLVPWKHIDGVIDAVAGLNSKGVQVSLVIVGEGPDHAALVRHAEEKLNERVIFTGALSHQDTLAVMQAADALVLNSSYEGLSHLLIEALMIGVPTVATRVGGNPEVITDGEDGLLVPVNDTQVLMDSLERILLDKALRTHVTVRARESAKRFATETMLMSVAATLQAL